MAFRKRMLQHGPRTGVLAASIGALIASGGISTSAVAQDQDDDEQTEADDVVIVTGTRIRRDDFTSPNATSVVSADDMQALGVISVADMVNQLPNNVAAVSPESNPDSAFNVGASIANLRGLNTFNGTRTLTMVDSRRFVATNNGGGVDMNFIPSALVGRIETVTGGAAATYGADAMAGVVNVILDTNIDTIKVDLGYQTTAEGDGDRYNFSFATGTELLDGRGHFTVGIDWSDQEAINDCLSRDYCRVGRGLLRNGNGTGTGFFGFGPPIPYSTLSSQTFPDMPQWNILEGFRHTNLTEGMLFASGFAGGRDGFNSNNCPGYDPNLPIEQQPITANNLRQYNGSSDPQGDGALECGAYRITPDGKDILPYLEDLTYEQRRAIDVEGWTGDTPWGEGKSPYASVPLRPETTRGNIFTRFQYELEGGIELAADLSFGQTENTVLQKQSRDNMQQFCIQADNAYLLQGSDAMRAVFQDRWTTGSYSTAFLAQTDWAIQCDEPPFMGGSFLDAREDGRFDFRPGTVFSKDMSEHLDRQNHNKTDVTTFTLNANGDLFEGGTWTWDTYYTYGKSEGNVDIQDWRSDNRMQMALDAVFLDPNADPNDPNAEIVCRIDLPEGDPRRIIPKWVDFDPNDPNPANQVEDGQYYEEFRDIEEKWITFYEVALKDDYPADQVAEEAVRWFNTLSQGCATFNPFGSPELVPISAAAKAFAFPTIVESTDITQHQLSFNFSGELHRGIGAGPLLLAAGIDWRSEETFNQTGDDPISARDFLSNFNGVNAFGDNWAGKTTNSEAYAELEMPFLRDVTAANYLMINIADRRTRNETERLQGRDLVDQSTFQKFTRYVDSWKASLVWKPVEMMTVRMTRSSDTRAPSARELFQTNTGAQQAGGQNELLSPFRADDPNTGQAENGDQYENISGGNSRLSAERALTETIGVVFQPLEVVPGLEVALDYYETTVKGGIEEVSAIGTLNRCASQEIGEQIPPEEYVFCRNVVFGPPDQSQLQLHDLYGCGYDEDETPNPNPDGCTLAEAQQILPYTNVLSLSSSQVNVAPYWNRGLDISMSYSKQLSGGGFISGRVLATRFLEQSVDLMGQRGRTDVSGQTGSNGLTEQFGSFGINYTPTPRIRGNMWLQYNKNAMTVAAQILYTGTGRLNQQDGWIMEGEYGVWVDNGVQQVTPYAVNILDTVTKSTLPSWTTMNLNLAYDFSRSRFSFDRFQDLSVFLNITNVGDKIPNFFSGRNAGGLNTTYFSGMGREYNIGVRMEF